MSASVIVAGEKLLLKFLPQRPIRCIGALLLLTGILGTTVYLFLMQDLYSGFTNVFFLDESIPASKLFNEFEKTLNVDLYGNNSKDLSFTYGRIWPVRNQIEDDRIFNQLNYLYDFARIRVSNSTPAKIILRIGNFNFNHLLWENGQQHLINEKCPVTNCKFSSDVSNFSVADALVISEFNSRDLRRFTPKPSHQIWVAQYLEPPHQRYLDSQALNGLINWTAGYRRDSTIVIPYGKWYPAKRSPNCSEAAISNCTDCLGNCQSIKCFNNQCCCRCPCENDALKMCMNCSVCQNISSPGSDNTNMRDNYAAGKTKKVATFISNCRDINGRRRYAWELGKYINVDFFGDCGGLTCPKVDSKSPMTFFKNPCFDMLKKDYKFFLSFENSNCAGYITEKLHWNALLNDVVPIVMGARIEDYAVSAPPGSYIHVDDFDSPQDLAKYLKLLDSNDTLYNEYFRYKQNYHYIDVHDTRYWCRLCGLLHLADHVKYVNWIDDFEKWTHETCSTKNDGPNSWKTWKKGGLEMTKTSELIKVLDFLMR